MAANASGGMACGPPTATNDPHSSPATSPADSSSVLPISDEGVHATRLGCPNPRRQPSALADINAPAKVWIMFRSRSQLAWES